MCIAIVSTAHPEYSLIIIDNRDEFILRPTSRPHWWTHPVSGEQVVSSRDLQRAEQGTWLALNRAGDFAVLTNYREDIDESICGTRSRGGMPTAWLSGIARDGVTHGVHHLVKDGGVKGVGGFSMICGTLRKSPKPIAIVSNRVDHVDDVPFVGRERGQTWSLSNTTYISPEKWPKVISGHDLTESAIKEAVDQKLDEAGVVEALFAVLDRDTLPRLPRHASVQDYMPVFKESIFVPPVGTQQQENEFAESAAKGRVGWDEQEEAYKRAAAQPILDATVPYSTGLYGTQRQTVILVDWEGNVTYVERALWDPNGNRFERGAADVTVRYKIEGWEN